MMFKFMFNSFEVNGATITTSLNFIFNNALNLISGYLLFKEKINYYQIIGILAILIGILII